MHVLPVGHHRAFALEYPQCHGSYRIEHRQGEHRDRREQPWPGYTAPRLVRLPEEGHHRKAKTQKEAARIAHEQLRFGKRKIEKQKPHNDARNAQTQKRARRIAHTVIKMPNANAAMNDRLPASPSIPSMKLMAFATPTIQPTLTTTDNHES